jgi:hypothetical protein
MEISGSRGTATTDQRVREEKNNNNKRNSGTAEGNGDG